MDNLEQIAGKINKGERLSKGDGLMLLQSRDILFIGKLAHAVKKRKTGDHVFFNVNCHINLTNVCVSRCTFCAFSCDRGDPAAYTMTADEAAERVRRALPVGITEVHMVSGLHPALPFQFYVDVVGKLKNEFPSLHIKAFTPVEKEIHF